MYSITVQSSSGQAHLSVLNIQTWYHFLILFLICIRYASQRWSMLNVQQWGKHTWVSANFQCGWISDLGVYFHEPGNEILNYSFAETEHALLRAPSVYSKKFSSLQSHFEQKLIYFSRGLRKHGNFLFMTHCTVVSSPYCILTHFFVLSTQVFHENVKTSQTWRMGKVAETNYIRNKKIKGICA